MIAGVTHLTMEADLDRGVGLGAALGLRAEFRDEVELPPSFEKVQDNGPTLPLALLAGPSGIRLEVVQHKRRTDQQSAYTAIFRCAPPVAAGSVVERPEVGAILRKANTLLDPICVAITATGAEAWFESSSQAGGLAGLLCRARDVRAEAEFWSTFARAKWTEVDQAAAWGSVPSPLPQARCEFVIVHCDEPSVYAMNDAGFPSMGVYSTSVDDDCARAVAAGATVRAEPIVTTVGGRVLRMALISTPSGAPVEILGVQRNPRRQQGERGTGS
jgi:hypothetical protein